MSVNRKTKSLTPSEEVLSPRTRQYILAGCAIAVIVYSVIVLNYANLIPQIGVDLFGSDAAGQIVRAVKVESVWGKSPEVGDRVERIAGRPIKSLPVYVNTLAYLNRDDRFPAQSLASLEDLSATAASVAEIDGARYVRVDFRSAAEGEPADVPSRAAWFQVSGHPIQSTFISILWCAMESFVFWMGWVVYRRRPQDDAAALFFLMCIVTVGAYMGGYHWLQIASSPALTFIFAICAMAVPQVTLHFFLVYPTPKAFLLRYPRTMLFVLYLIPGVLAIAVLWTIGSVVSSFRHDLPVVRIDHLLSRLWWLVTMYLAMGCSMFVGCVASLMHSYLHARQPIQKSQVRWILSGAVVAGFFLGYSFYLALSDAAQFALGGATWAMFASSLVFTCAYAVGITRYRMMYVDDILQRGVVYLLITFAGTLCYYGLLFMAIWFSPRLAAETSHGQVLVVSTVVISALMLLSTVRSRVQLILDRRFYREKHLLERAVRRMDEAVGKLVDRDKVMQRALFVLGDTLGARDAAIYMRVKGGGFELGQQIGQRTFPHRFPDRDELVRKLQSDALLQSRPGPTAPGDAVTPLLRRLGVEMAQPFLIDHALVGFVLIGAKQTGLYTSAELEFLAGLAELTSMALFSAETQRTLESLNEELREKVNRIARQKQLRDLQATGSAPLGESSAPEAADEETFLFIESIRGKSPAVAEMVRAVRKVASSSATVLIRGESGAGKSLLAEVIHRNSPRSEGPFVKVHCAALSPGVLESELFGHVKGAFTGAHRDKIGRFEMADGGTLFLDEVGDIALDIQTKLLRVLQEMTFEPVGSSESRRIDVRVIAATHQPLEELVRRGRFREDLFYRINVISLRVPPLRDRREDILELAMEFLKRSAEKSQRPVTSFDDDVIERLVDYDWPGNIRELENVVERAVVMASGPIIGLEDLPLEMREPSRPGLALARVAAPVAAGSFAGPLDGELDELEKARLLDALAAGGGNKTRAARLLGLPRSTFCSKLKRLGLD